LVKSHENINASCLNIPYRFSIDSNVSDSKLILQSRKRCSASSSQHVDCGSESRGSGGELLGAFDTFEWVIYAGSWGSCHGCSWCLVAICSGILGLASLDDHPGLSNGDLGGTAAESFGTGVLLSLWSEGTI